MGLGNRNALGDPREAGMETGTRAERADKGTSVGLGSQNGLRDPRERKKKEEKAESRGQRGSWEQKCAERPK